MKVDPAAGPEGIVKQYSEALDRGDARAVCRLLTRPSVANVSNRLGSGAGKATVGSCAGGLAVLLDGPGVRADTAPKPGDPVKIQVRGREAVAKAGDGKSTVRLEKERGLWKVAVSSFFE